MSREMKESGVDWIGSAPVDWKIQKAKFLFKQHNEKGNNINLQLLSPTQKYGVIPQDEYEKLSGMRAVKLIVNDDLSKMKSIHKGDFCISLRSFQGGFEYSRYEGVVSPAYQVFNAVSGEVYDEYYRYLFKCDAFIDKMRSYTMTLRDGKNIAFSDFADTCIYIPPLSEQRQIVSFLDRKCSAIDTAIEKTKKSIEKLEEYKKAVITKAVTKGLDPDAKMKDSGLGWIGTIPESWSVSKFKYHTKQKSVRNPGDATILSLYREYGIVIKDSRDDNFNRTSLDTSSYRYVEINDFVVNKMKAWQGSVAVSEYEGVVSPAYYVYSITDNEIYPRYFHYLLRSCYKDEFMRLSGGIRIGQWDLPADALGDTMILKPSYDEQKAISEYIDKKTAAVEELITKKQKAISKWEEYKKSLIYYAVTGKIDCRNEAI